MGGLGVRDGGLISIRNNIHVHDDGERLVEMLRIWRDSSCSPFTWHIINVLEAPAIDLKRAAEGIHSRLSKGGNLYDKYSKQG